MSSTGPASRGLIPQVLMALARDVPHLLAFVASDIIKIKTRTVLEESSSGPHWWPTSSSSILVPPFAILLPLSFYYRRVGHNVC